MQPSLPNASTNFEFCWIASTIVAEHCGGLEDTALTSILGGAFFGQLLGRDKERRMMTCNQQNEFVGKRGRAP